MLKLEGLHCAQHGEEDYSVGIGKIRKENNFDWCSVHVVYNYTALAAVQATALVIYSIMHR